MSTAADYLPSVRAKGTIRVVAVEGEYRFRLSELDRLYAALDAGEVWFTGEDNNGGELRVRLAQVEAVIAYTPQAVARAITDEDVQREEIRARNMTKGDPE